MTRLRMIEHEGNSPSAPKSRLTVSPNTISSSSPNKISPATLSQSTSPLADAPQTVAPVTMTQTTSSAANTRSTPAPEKLSTVQSSQQLPQQPFEPTEEFLAELAEQNARLESATPEEIIAWAYQRYGTGLTMGTAFGPEGCVILSMIAKIAPELYVFNLDTGYQFQQTLDLRDRIAEKYGIEVDMLQPELTVPEYEAKHGGPLYKTNPTQCCFDRKIKLLQQGVQGRTAWMSGIRRDQSPDRAQAAIVGWDKKFSMVKVTPLANWTKSKVWTRVLDESVPYNPLHDQNYPSVGCWPCTRAQQAGETDDRSGRWSGSDKTECGLHTIQESGGSGI